MDISAITEQYIKDRLMKNAREKGRGLLSYREIKIKTGTLQNAEGSAEVEIGHTKVLAGIKIDLGEPMSDTPEEGTITTSTELLPMASSEFDVGPPGPESIELARVIDRGVRAAKVVDSTKLFIEDGKVWNVYIDVYVLNYDGNLFDAGTMAATSALLTSRMPRYENEEVIRENLTEKLPTSNICTSCTFGKIGNKIVLDTDGNEEEFVEARLTIANDENYIRAMQKGLRGSFKTSELQSIIEMTFEKSKELRSIVKKACD